MDMLQTDPSAVVMQLLLVSATAHTSLCMLPNRLPDFLEACPTCRTLRQVSAEHRFAFRGHATHRQAAAGIPTFVRAFSGSLPAIASKRALPVASVRRLRRYGAEEASKLRLEARSKTRTAPRAFVLQAFSRETRRISYTMIS